MIHQYKNNGYYIILDVNSGSVHSADALLYDAVEILSEIVPDMETPAPLTKEQEQAVRTALAGRYEAAEIGEVLEEIQALIDAEELFTADVYKNYVTIHAREDYTVKRTLGAFEEELDSGFFRAGRSMIVNLKYIRRVTKKEVYLSDGTVLPLPRGVYEALNRAIINGG